MRLALTTLLAGSASLGCLQSSVHGGTNGSATSSATGSISGPSSTGGTAAGSTGSGTGPLTSSGTTASASSTGTSTGTATGTGTASGGGTTGTFTGGTTGATTGSCGAFGIDCAGNADCCSGACLETCRQGSGQRCLTDGDCSSGNCKNDACACATPAQFTSATCATNADCCNDLPCHFFQIYGYGLCCNAIGGSCSDDYDCCDSNCVNGTCACLPVISEDCQPGDCCTGECVRLAQSFYAECLNDTGESCDATYDCATESCVDGGCGSCSETGGVCNSSLDCCSGGVCATFLQGGFEMPITDAGTACCGENGSSCDPAGRGSECCSEQCSDAGLCACVQTTGECVNDQSCCAGGACMPRASSGGGSQACCQIDGQSCFETNECCSGNCQNGACACVSAGGGCGPFGYFAAAGPGACCSGICADGGVCQ